MLIFTPPLDVLICQILGGHWANPSPWIQLWIMLMIIQFYVILCNKIRCEMQK